MHVSMNYKGIRRTPGAQASGVFDLYWMQRRRLAAQMRFALVAVGRGVLHKNQQGLKRR